MRHRAAYAVTSTPHPLARHLLWVDCTAGAVAGAVVLLLAEWLSRVEGLPVGVLRVTGAANVAYAACSFSLAVRGRRPRWAIAALVAANAAWAAVCVALALAFAASATGWGLAHLLGEGVFVGALAALEWANRAELAGASGP